MSFALASRKELLRGLLALRNRKRGKEISGLLNKIKRCLA
jgi:hypothetical protein